MSNAVQIYSQLRAAGMTHAGTCGVLGNWQAESGLEPCRLQGDFSPTRILSHTYVSDVTAGRITRAQFARDQKGFGLAQWTYFNFTTGQGRKLDLYDFWKKSGKALDDASMQVSFALQELTGQSQYAGLWQILRTTEDLYTATDRVCRLYEQPYYCNVDARFRCAKELEAEIAAAQNASLLPVADSDPADEISDSDNCTFPAVWPPRMLDRTMSGADVAVLQAILAARGWSVETDGTVGDLTDQAIRQFQCEHALTVDGVCGPLTWKELLRFDR